VNLFSGFSRNMRDCDCDPKPWLDGRRMDWAGEVGSRWVRVMLDFGGGVLWDNQGQQCPIEMLPVSRTLAADLAAWSRDFEALGDLFAPDAPVPYFSERFPTEWFNRRGDALTKRIRQELGPEWTVIHQPLLRKHPRNAASQGARA